MERDQDIRHMCKICDKIFPCGRSLGGHMRSHLIKQSESSDKLSSKKLSSFCNYDNEVAAAQNGYSLREMPKKTSKFSLDHLEATVPSKGIRKQRSRNTKRYTNTTNAATITSSLLISNDSPCVSEIKQELEEVALSLLLLSRDVTVNWDGRTSKVDSFENVSPTSISRNGIEQKEGTETKKQKAANKREWSLVDSSSMDSSPFSFVGSEKKSKFSCNSCNKIFHSYQALGGHRATYKKMKGCFGLKIDNSSENSSTIETEVISLSLNQTADSNEIIITDEEKIKTLDYGSKKKAEKVHECQICFKIFLSGQALGGHKRTHLFAAAGEAKSKKLLQSEATDHLSKVENKKILPEIRDFLDLNLPAAAATPPEHELVENNATTTQVYCKSPWWIGNNHKQRQLVGLFL